METWSLDSYTLYVLPFLSLLIVLWMVYRKESSTWTLQNCPVDLTGKTAVVTGANSGIGKAVCYELARRGAHVVLGCRNLTQGRKALEDIQKATGNKNLLLRELDLSSVASIQRFSQKLLVEEPHIHLLVNNAGICGLPYKTITSDGLELTFMTNYLGHFLLTNLLLGKHHIQSFWFMEEASKNVPRGKQLKHILKDIFVKEIKRFWDIDPMNRSLETRRLLLARQPEGLLSADSARVVNVTSFRHKYGIVDEQHLVGAGCPLLPHQCYDSTKLLLVLFTKELARRLKGTGVTVNSVEPGIVKTGIMKNFTWLYRSIYCILSVFLKTAAQGAIPVLYLSLAEELHGISGKYFNSKCNLSLPVESARDPGVAHSLWNTSARLINLEKMIKKE